MFVRSNDSHSWVTTNGIQSQVNSRSIVCASLKSFDLDGFQMSSHMDIDAYQVFDEMPKSQTGIILSTSLSPIPDEFHGINPREWLFQANLYFKNSVEEWNNFEKVKYASFFMFGLAETWFIETFTTEPKEHWECFCEKMLARFANPFKKENISSTSVMLELLELQSNDIFVESEFSKEVDHKFDQMTHSTESDCSESITISIDVDENVDFMTPKKKGEFEEIEGFKTLEEMPISDVNDKKFLHSNTAPPATSRVELGGGNVVGITSGADTFEMFRANLDYYSSGFMLDRGFDYSVPRASLSREREINSLLEMQYNHRPVSSMGSQYLPTMVDRFEYENLGLDPQSRRGSLLMDDDFGTRFASDESSYLNRRLLAESLFYESRSGYISFGNVRLVFNGGVKGDVSVEEGLDVEKLSSLSLSDKKELTGKSDSLDVANKAIQNYESKVKDLQQQLRMCVTEKNELKLIMKEAQTLAQEANEKYQEAMLAQKRAEEDSKLVTQVFQMKDKHFRSYILVDSVKVWNPGIIHRAVKYIFAKIRMTSERGFFSVDTQKLQIHGSLEHGVFVAGLKEEIGSLIRKLDSVVEFYLPMAPEAKDESVGKVIPSAESEGFQFYREDRDKVLPDFADSIIGIKHSDTRSFPYVFPNTWNQEDLRTQFTVGCKELFYRDLERKDVKEEFKMAERKSLKKITRIVEQEKQEPEIFLDMIGQQIYDKRDLTEIKESEKRAHLQSESLWTAPDEHSLELRMKAEFYRFHVEGLSDITEFKGHRITDIGAMTRKLVHCLENMGTTNPLVLIEEIDKMGRGHAGGPARTMLELLDPDQKANLLDHYLDVAIERHCTNRTMLSVAGELQNMKCSKDILLQKHDKQELYEEKCSRALLLSNRIWDPGRQFFWCASQKLRNVLRNCICMATTLGTRLFLRGWHCRNRVFSILIERAGTRLKSAIWISNHLSLLFLCTCPHLCPKCSTNTNNLVIIQGEEIGSFG